MSELPPGAELAERDGKWVLMTLGPSGVTTTTFETRADAEAAIESHRRAVQSLSTE
jgi:hypothetical protein